MLGATGAIIVLQLPRKRLWPQIAIALLLTGTATGLVMRETWEDDSWMAISSFNPRFLVGAAGLLVLAWIVDAGRLHAICRAMGYRISIRSALRTNFLGYFLSAITPFASGGGPLQVYSLTRSGVPIGYGTAAVLLSGFLAHSTLAMTGIYLVFFSNVPLRFDPRIDQWIRAGVLLYAGGLLTLAFLVWHVERGRRFIQAVVRWVLRFTSDKRRVRTAAAAVDRVIVDLHQGLRSAARRRRWALLGLVAYFIYFATYFSIVPTLAAGLGATPPHWNIVGLLVPVYMFASVLPTPGGTGGLEFGLARGLIGYLPAAQIGVIVAVWRLLTYYTVVAVSGTVVLFFVRAELAHAAHRFTAASAAAVPSDLAGTSPTRNRAVSTSASANRTGAISRTSDATAHSPASSAAVAPTAWANRADRADLAVIKTKRRAPDRR